MSCPEEPTPSGWSVWTGPVPTELTQAAMDIRDHVRSYTRGTFAKTMTYNGQTIGFWVSSHTWTWKNGVLLTGICIPGVSILIQKSIASPSAALTVGVSPAADPLLTPDPTAAVYGADDVPPAPDYGLVAICAAAIGGVIALFWTAIKKAGR